MTAGVVDSGSNALNALTVDVEGDDRTVDGDSNLVTTIDMGADEFDTFVYLHNVDTMTPWPFDLTTTVATQKDCQWLVCGPTSRDGNCVYVLLSNGKGCFGGVNPPDFSPFTDCAGNDDVTCSSLLIGLDDDFLLTTGRRTSQDGIRLLQSPA